MIQLILFFGVFFAVAGVIFLVRPSLLIGLLDSQGDRKWVYTSAIGVRLVLGLLLIQQAANSRFPLVMEILGWILLAAALLLAVMGRQRFERLMRWILGIVKPFAWAGGLFAIVFGLFLVYGFSAAV